ncbi:MAG: Rrf2 family transcriptional regulator [Mariprofundaceae bacterium]
MLELLSSRRLMRLLTALLHIAADGSALSGRTLSERMNCPRRYLEADLQRLARGGILESQRGAGGGYRLARSPARIFLLDVMRCLSDEKQAQADEGCELLAEVVQPALDELAREFQLRLSDSSLADWLKRGEKLGLVRSANQASNFSI